MAKNLLNGCNEVLKKAENIDSDGELSSLTDSARQVWIDNAVQSLNEVVDELYELPQFPARPSQVTEATIVLATGDQNYALASDLQRILPKFALIDETNNHVIVIDDRPEAYRDLIIRDLEQNDTGTPSVAAIRPTDGQLWLDRAPTAAYNGNTYKYRYEKDLSLSVAADTFPFSDSVFRAVVEAATQKYMKLNHRDYDERTYKSALARAASRLSQFPRRRSWDQPAGVNLTDPFVET